jgi:hypothetical protein
VNSLFLIFFGELIQISRWNEELFSIWVSTFAYKYFSFDNKQSAAAVVFNRLAISLTTVNFT